jgi:thioredoxin-dependent peroxiredoxin
MFMKTFLTAAVCIVVMLVIARAFAAERQKTPKAGATAPPVEGVDQDGKPWKLADLAGKKIVLLYFYPKDDTPGCTKEACSLRDRIGELQTNNVQVVGVSFDTGASHQKFIAKYQLNFLLLADTDGKIADAYGARMVGPLKMARRVSFLIGLDGKIAHVTDAMNPDVHLAEMRDAIAELAKK